MTDTQQSDSSKPRNPAAGSHPADLVHSVEVIVEHAVEAAERSLAARLGAGGMRLLLWTLRAVGWLALTAYFVFCLTLIGLRLWWMPHIDDWRGEIERRASEVLKQQVSIGRIEASWQGFNPRLQLTNVQLHDSTGAVSLALPQIEAVLSWTSVPTLQASVKSLIVLAPEVEVRRVSDSRLKIAGMLIDLEATDSSAAALDWLLEQRHVAVTHAIVHYYDEAPGSTQATVGSDQSGRGAVYKGLAIATTTAGSFLYAADFHHGVVDMFDSSFHLVGSFTDDRLPHGYAPFGIQTIGAVIYVTFAKQDKAAHDDVPGKGRGFVDAFDPSGVLMQRIASRGKLNAPWGIALAPATFGAFAGDLLIGNFGDGTINAFSPVATGPNGQLHSKGQLLTETCAPVVIDGLWALQFGNGSGSGSMNALYFTAGPDEESHGLFGNLVPTAGPTCDQPEDDGSGADD